MITVTLKKQIYTSSRETNTITGETLEKSPDISGMLQLTYNGNLKALIPIDNFLGAINEDDKPPVIPAEPVEPETIIEESDDQINSPENNQ